MEGFRQRVSRSMYGRAFGETAAEEGSVVIVMAASYKINTVVRGTKVVVGVKMRILHQDSWAVGTGKDLFATTGGWGLEL